MTKPMTAAEYAAHAETQKSQQPTEVKTLKSGAVFELRKPDLQRLVVLGLVPQSLVDEGLKAWEASGIKPTGKVQGLPDAQTTQRALILMRESFSKQDFNEIYLWAMGVKEGQATEGLRSFRKGRKRRTAAGEPSSAELQPETISTAAN
jgi:hypothetical protein